ncbi:hypothetical protein GCM10009804_75050 [Kribbella hippodromi]|uniref:Uncharacterized protein n=1 Tax=Kribbella hippodromi TaxID=434347 RepID=A0ABP4QEF0_9ACTN
MTDRIEVDQLGIARASDDCRTAGTDAGTQLARLLAGLTKGAIEAAAGRDDYGRQIIDGWANSQADTFPEFAKGIEEQLIGRGDQMSSCGENARSTDDAAAQQVRATDLGLKQTAQGWATLPPDQGA